MSERSELLDQNHKVEVSKLCRYLETYRRALEKSLQLKTFSEDSITFLLCMLLERLVRDRTSVRARAQLVYPPSENFNFTI